MVATLALLAPLLAPCSLPHGGSYTPPPPPLSGPRSMGLGRRSGPKLPAGSKGGPATSHGPLPGFTQGPVGSGNLDWTRWWELESDALLDLRGLPAPGPISGEVDGKASRMVLVPGRAAVAETVVPALLKVVKFGRDDAMVSAALIAASRLGQTGDAELDGAVVVAIARRLESKSREISETAALSLGILGSEAALEPLFAILRATDEAGALLGREIVPTRTRAFAAFGLGLAADRSGTDMLRQRVAAALMEVLSVKHASEDLPAAAMLSLGICPAPLSLAVPDDETRAGPHAHDVVSRTAQLRWLQAQVDGSRRIAAAEGGVRLPLPALCQAIVALGRLAQDAPEPARRNALVLLEEFATKKAAHAHVRTSAAIALGHAMTGGWRPADRAGRQSLVKILKSGQALERRFAALALAESSARPGPAFPPGSDAVEASAQEPPGLEGVTATRQALSRQLARGRSDAMPWYAMALGLQRLRLGESSAVSGITLPWNSTVGLTMREKLRKESSASRVAAYSLACALVHRGADAESLRKAGAQVHGAFQRTQDPAARGRIALALGWLRFEPAHQELIDLMEPARFNPELLRSLCVALVLYGDATVVPRLLEMLDGARSVSSRAAVAAALGSVGDRRAIEPLLTIAESRRQPTLARAFAIVALGKLCEPKPLPWKSPVARGTPYFAATEALRNGASGLLDLN